MADSGAVDLKLRCGLFESSVEETFHPETGLPRKPLQFKLRLERPTFRNDVLEMPDAIRSEWRACRSLRIMWVHDVSGIVLQTVGREKPPRTICTRERQTDQAGTATIPSHGLLVDVGHPLARLSSCSCFWARIGVVLLGGQRCACR